MHYDRAHGDGELWAQVCESRFQLHNREWVAMVRNDSTLTAAVRSQSGCSWVVVHVLAPVVSLLRKVGLKFGNAAGRSHCQSAVIARFSARFLGHV